LESVYGETISPNKALLLGVITIREDEGIENSGGQSGGGSSEEGSSGGQSSSSEQNTKKLANLGNAIIIKDGKKVLDLSFDQMFALSWGRNRKEFGVLELRDYSDNVFTNADLNFYVFKNKAKLKTKFENGIPICEVSISPELMLNETSQDIVNKEFYKSTYHLDSDSVLISNINKRIGSDFSESLKTTLANNIDILDVYDIFYSNNNKEFKNYLANLENPDDYVLGVEFRINVETKIVE
jgi:hypothetical protein